MLREIFLEQRRTPGTLKHAFSQNRKWGGRDRKIAAEIIYECVRWWRRLHFSNFSEWTDAYLHSQTAQKHLPENYLIANLHLQLCRMDLDTGDLLDRSEYESALQRFNAAEDFAPAVIESTSDVFFSIGERELAVDWSETLKALNEAAPVFLRVNSLKASSVEEVKKALHDEGIETETVDDVEMGLKLNQRQNVFATETYKKGLFEMQDAASQQVAPLLAPQPGERVIDACAGAGGKTLHISALMKNKGQLIALDITDWKLEELQKRAARAGCDNVETRRIESTKTIKRLHDSADAVLLDVPCTGSGTIRRYADAKWKIDEEELQQLIHAQREILDRYSKMVKPGGRLVYSTCSVFPSENQKQIAWALEGPMKGWSQVSEYINLPQKTGFDGFYAVLLKRPESA
ncbi:MAG: RsmB/NOP family class I SAM-dependent RNA methyltransferase [Bdellovibrionales bacterium]|nr:RsmB/NOP family class I SAM-dependent RNA methyltransferase [Bdellovibrionales bacterium]